MMAKITILLSILSHCMGDGLESIKKYTCYILICQESYIFSFHNENYTGQNNPFRPNFELPNVGQKLV